MREKIKANKKKILKYGIIGIAGVVVLLVAGAIAWPFISPIKVTNSSLPYEYTIYGTYIEINRYTGDEEEVVIPDRICFRPVEVLGVYEPEPYVEEGAFSECNTIKTVYIPDSVEEIMPRCFDWCFNLESVDLSNSLHEISYATFSCCVSLQTIVIPEGIEEISQEAFWACKSLYDVHFPESLKKINAYAFYGCSKLENVIIPVGIERISGCSFENTQWQNNFKEDFVIVGKNVLIYYGGDESVVNIPEGVEYIGSNVFDNKKNMIQLNLPNSLRECSVNMFCRCDNLKYVVVKNSEMEFTGNGNLFEEEYSDAKLVGAPGSVAESFAKENGYTFLESIPEE